MGKIQSCNSSHVCIKSELESMWIPIRDIMLIETHK